MTPTRVLVLFGTRPELIKLAPLILKLKADPRSETLACSTGQHREMLRQAMDIFGIEADRDLDLMRPNQDLFDVTAHTLLRLREVLTDLKPDVVVVQGDTTTAFTAALAAFYLRIPVAHVEAGLRSYDPYNPFPEEANRRFVSAMATYHFAPTGLAYDQLIREGVPAQDIHLTGNTVVDALELVKERVAEPQADPRNPFVLVTLHRREKFGDRMRVVFDTLADLARENPGLDFIYPVHLNPNVKGPAEEHLGSIDNMKLIPPQDYLRFNRLMQGCRFILSDSGGIQEEAYSFRKPVIVLRDVTERMEAVEAGYALLVGDQPGRIRAAFAEVEANLAAGHDYFHMPNPYGDGRASERIAEVLLGGKPRA